jgi:predicted enzyme related to lactoylglutathione lyase
MASIKGPDFIALQVSDLERSKKFYTDIVGLKPAPQSPPDAVLFLTNPIPFAIRKPHPGTDLKAVSQLGHGVALWFLCDDSIQFCQSLKGKGVVVLDEPTPGPFGMTFHLKDVDGYIVTVHDKT